MQPLTKYIAEEFGIDANTSATILITLGIFVLGYALNGLNNSFVSFRTRRNFRTLFTDIVNAISVNRLKL